MTRETISNAVGNISTHYIQEAGAYSDRSAEESRAMHGRPAVKRFLALASVLVLCSAFTISALAKNVAPVYEMLYSFSPTIAQRLKPVALSCESSGIKMEVLSADIEGDTAYIYVSLQDLIGNRIDSTTDLFDSYTIRSPFDCSFGCHSVSFDEETNTAFFLITMTKWDEKEITGRKITFTVSQILSQKQEFDAVIPQLDLSEASMNPRTQTGVEVRGSSGTGTIGENIAQDEVLAASPEPLCIPTEGVSITAMGYIDGKLHIQTYYDDILHTDNHGYVYLLDSSGSKIYCDMSKSFWDENHIGSYQEYIFDMTPNDAVSYTLAGEFLTCGTLTEGDWQVTFSL